MYILEHHIEVIYYVCTMFLYVWSKLRNVQVIQIPRLGCTSFVEH